MWLAVIGIGFALMTLGVALLFLGEVPFLLGKRLPALRSRLIGLVFLAYLPLAVGVRQGIRVGLGDDAVAGEVVLWVMLGVCLFSAFLLVFRVLFPKKAPRSASAPVLPHETFESIPASPQDAVPFGEPEPPAPTSAKPGPKANPFDFS